MKLKYLAAWFYVNVLGRLFNVLVAAIGVVVFLLFLPFMIGDICTELWIKSKDILEKK